MNDEELELLNKVLYEYLYYFLIDTNEIKIIQRLNEFVINNKLKHYNLNYNGKVGISRSYKISYEFLSSIKLEYGEYLETRWNNDAFDLLYYKNKNIQDIARTYYDEQINANKIILPINNNIEDSFTITHEIIHDYNLKKNSPNSFQLLCETLSILSELLQADYMKINYPNYKEIYKNKNNILFAIEYKSRIIDFEIYLINTYASKGKITKSDIINYISSINDYEKEIISITLDKILVEEDLCIHTEQRNILGIFIASYMHDRIINDKKSINEFTEINDNINEMSIYDILKLLDLEIEDTEYGELKEKSYRKLFNSYNNEIRR